MARKPHSSLRSNSKKELIEALNTKSAEQYTTYGKARERLGELLLADADWLYAEAKRVIQSGEGGSVAMPRYLMLKVLLDKIIPDRREVSRTDIGPRAPTTLIQVNGVRRGTTQAREAALKISGPVAEVPGDE